MKATIVTSANNYSVSLSNGQTGLHPQPKSEISKEKYQRLLVKNYGYDFLIDKIDQALNVIEDDFDPNITNPITGEVTEQGALTKKEQAVLDKLDEIIEVQDEIIKRSNGGYVKQIPKQEFPQEPFINPLKQTEMETPKPAPKKRPSRAKAKAQPAIQAEVINDKPKQGVIMKTRGISARLAESGIRGVGVAGCTILYGIADLATLSGDLWAQGAAAAIKPLGNHPDATRSEIADSIKLTANKTLATVYTVPLVAYAAITKPKAIVDKAVNNQPKVATV